MSAAVLVPEGPHPARVSSAAWPLVAAGALGFIGSLLLNLVGNSGAPRAPGAYWRWVTPLNGRKIGLLPALHVDQLAFLALIAGWLIVGLQVRRGRCAPRWVLILAAIWAAPLLLTPPLFSDDIYDYVAVGALQVHHFDPYLVGAHSLSAASRIVGAVSPAWSRTPSPYGPALLLLARGAAAVAGTHDIVAVMLLRLLAVAALAVVVAVIVTLTREAGRDPGPALWLMVANPLVLISVVGGGHNDIVMMAAMLTGYLAYRRGHPYLAALLVAGAAEIKIVAIVGIGVLALLAFAGHTGRTPDRLRAGARQLTASVAAFAGLTTVLGLDLGNGLLGGWGFLRDLYVPGTVVTSITPTDAVYGILGGPLSAQHRRGQPAITLSGQPLLVHLRDLALLALVIVTLILASRLARLGPERLTGLVLLSVLLLGQILWPWYLIWPLAFLALAGTARERASMAVLSVALLFIDSPGGPTLFGDARHLPGRSAADLITIAGVAILLAVLCSAPSTFGGESIGHRRLASGWASSARVADRR